MPETVLTLLPPVSRYILRVREPGKVSGLVLPLEACRATVSQGWQALWLGPDEFLLIEAPPVQPASASPPLAGGGREEGSTTGASSTDPGAAPSSNLLPRGEEAFPGGTNLHPMAVGFEGRGGGIDASLKDIAHSLVEVTDRQLAFALEGPHAADVLNAGCPLDLDLAAFPVGMCTRTVLVKSEIVLWRQAEQRFHVEVWRSFSDYVRQLLEQVISEYNTPA